MKLVSILIPTYNRRDLVVKTIESALKQTYRNIEIIISDNCSSDGTVDYLKKLYDNYSNIKILQNETNIGPVNNWIKCINNSSGTYSKLLFSDDQIADNYIEETVNILESNNDVGFVYTQVVVVTPKRKISFYKTFQSSKKVLSNLIDERFLCGFNTPVSPGAALFRKDDLLKSIKLDIPNKRGLDFKVYGAGIDLNIYFEVLKNYNYVYYLSTSKAYFSAHDDSFTISKNLDYYYQTVRMNYLKQRKHFLKFLFLGVIIKSNLTKLIHYSSQYLNK